MFFKNLKVGVQIALVFAAGVLLFIAVAAVVLQSVRGINATSDNVNTVTGAREAASDVLLQMVDAETSVRGYVATGDPKFLQLLPLSQLHVLADMPVLHMRDADASAEEQAAVDKVQRSVDRMNAYFTEQIALVKSGHRAQAVARLNNEQADFEQLRRSVNDLASFAEIHTSDASDAQSDAELTLTQVIIGATALAVLLFASMAFLLGRRIGMRLATVSDALQTLAHEDVINFAVALSIVADGDLTTTYEFGREPLQVDGHDEIAGLAESYNSLVIAMHDLERAFGEATSRLRYALRGVLATSDELGSASVVMRDGVSFSVEAIDQISRALNEVALGAQDQAQRILSASSGAEQLSRTAEHIAAGAIEQANATRSAAESVYRLDEQIAALSDLAQRLSNVTDEAISQAASGSTAVTRTSDALDALRSVNSNTVNAMTTLETRTSAVSEILGTIDEIADQTNLLALNAAIEAARAGEHGRGFAVVADEVRKLAERATGATREIAEILNAIRKETLLAMQALRSSTARLEEGVEVASSGTEAISRIAGAVRDTAAVAGEVAERSTMMRRESGLITEHIGSVTAIVEENAAAAKQMQSTTVDLSGQLTPVAATAEEQSRTAEVVSSSALQLNQQMQDVLAFSNRVRSGSDALASVATRFAVEDNELPAAPERRSLTTNSAG